MKGALFWLVCRARRAGTRDFRPVLAALVGPVQNVCYLTAHYFTSFFHQTGQAVVPRCLPSNVSVVLSHPANIGWTPFHVSILAFGLIDLAMYVYQLTEAGGGGWLFNCNAWRARMMDICRINLWCNLIDICRRAAPHGGGGGGDARIDLIKFVAICTSGRGEGRPGIFKMASKVVSSSKPQRYTAHHGNIWTWIRKYKKYAEITNDSIM
jgi:hypothetical protein